MNNPTAWLVLGCGLIVVIGEGDLIAAALLVPAFWYLNSLPNVVETKQNELDRTRRDLVQSYVADRRDSGDA